MNLFEEREFVPDHMLALNLSIAHFQVADADDAHAPASGGAVGAQTEVRALKRPTRRDQKSVRLAANVNHLIEVDRAVGKRRQPAQHVARQRIVTLECSVAGHQNRGVWGVQDLDLIEHPRVPNQAVEQPRKFSGLAWVSLESNRWVRLPTRAHYLAQTNHGRLQSLIRFLERDGFRQRNFVQTKLTNQGDFVCDDPFLKYPVFAHESHGNLLVLERMFVWCSVMAVTRSDDQKP